MTEFAPPSRRRWLAQVAALGVAAAARPGWAQAPTTSPVRLAAAWEAGASYQVGVLAQQGDALAVQAALTVPTRAHGVWVETGARTGMLLAAARRPGDWLVRLRMADGQALAWHWMEGGRAFNGHVIASADGGRLYTTETDLENAEGLIGVRDADTLEKIAEWRTHGMDPHELLLDADGTLLVANGGIPTLPETGRLKVGLHRMDASLVRLDTRDGSLRGQWRVADRRLSLRHIAWGQDVQGARVLGIALQAEHEDSAVRQAAPLFARFDGRQLQVFGGDRPLAGYAGDIGFAAGRFALSCPRAQGVALWHADGRWAGFVPLAEVCALAPDTLDGRAARLWAGGAGRAQVLQGAAKSAVSAASATAAPSSTSATALTVAGLRLDNHWALLAG